jgi:DNA-binding NarL/FixJ family response regulator
MISIGIIDDHPLYRIGLTDMIQRASDLTLVATAGSVEEFGQHPPQRCDVLLLDLGLPGTSGPAAVAAVSPWTDAVLIVSGSEALGWVAAAITAGARGCVTKQAQEPEILGAIRAIARGHTYITATVGACRAAVAGRQVAEVG